MKFKIFTVIAFSILSIFSTFTYHPDLKAFILSSRLINSGEVFTFYDHISKLPTDNFLKVYFGDDYFIYQPLAYLIPSIFYLPFSNHLNQSAEKIIYDESSLSENSTYLPLFIYKLPFLIFSFLIFIYLPKLFNDERKKRLSQLLWILFPTNLLVSAGMGQVDVILLFFILLGIIELKKNNYLLSLVFFTLSSLIKPIAILAIPFVLIKSSKSKGIVYSLKIVLPSIVTWLVVSLPYLFSPAYKMYALMAGLSTKILYAGISITSAATIPWFFIIYILVILLYYQGKVSVINAIGMTIFSSIALNHFHPQWFLWSALWLIYTAINQKSYLVYSAILLSWIIIWLSFPPSLHIGLFLSLRDIYPANLPNPFENSLIVQLSRSVLVSYLILSLVNSHEKKS